MNCEGIKKKGDPCSFQAVESYMGKGYCKIHYKQALIKEEDKPHTTITKNSNNERQLHVKVENHYEIKNSKEMFNNSSLQSYENIIKTYMTDFENLKDFNTVSCKEMNDFLDKYRQIITDKTSFYLSNIEENPSCAMNHKITAYALAEATYKSYKKCYF